MIPMPKLLLAALLVAGVAGAEPTPEPELYFTDDSEVKFQLWEPTEKQTVTFIWDEPECPEGYGPLTVELPPEFWGYDKVEFACGLLIEPEVSND